MSSFDISSGYHSTPYSIPWPPRLSDERNDFSTPALTLLSSLLKASARSASLVSWLMNIREAFFGPRRVEGEVASPVEELAPFSESAIVIFLSPCVACGFKGVWLTRIRQL